MPTVQSKDGTRIAYSQLGQGAFSMPGTADCHRADVERFLPQVQLIPYP
jgi:hypothetical protein